MEGWNETMNKAFTWFAAALFGATIAVGAAPRVEAQTDPDIRNIRPVVMLLVDTSGSMERVSPANPADPAEPPVCTGSAGSSNERNRWTTVLEALTGEWNDTQYYCSAIDRATLPSNVPDFNYYLNYHEPPLGVAQLNTGVLDTYADRIKFGLMTFDSVYTFSDSHPLLVPETTFNARVGIGDNAGVLGGYSYGVPARLTYPGCGQPFMVDSGARNESASGGGRMVPVPVDDADILTTNTTIQGELLNLRPFGGTPTAALLEDFEYYLGNHPSVTGSDPFAGCRERYAVLLTDGEPDADFRDPARFDCQTAGGCPYDLPVDTADRLCSYDAGSDTCQSGTLDRLYVVALDVNATVLPQLDAIASAGGSDEAIRARSSTASCDPTTENCTTLLDALSQVLDSAANGNTTRTRPSFVTGSSTFASGNAPTQHEFNAGFVVGGSTGGAGWRGILERTQFQCNASDVPEPEAVDDRIRFDIELNQRNPDTRRLLTVVTTDANDMDGNLIGTEASSVPLGAATPASAVSGVSMIDFTAGISHSHFGIAGGSPTSRDDRRTRVVDWVWGRTSDRFDASCSTDPDWEEPCPSRMSDIYHSSPVTVPPPRLDIADESYNLFRRRPEVANRPTVLYVGTNDGVLHAFAAEDHNIGGVNVSAGEELWGFIPPILLEKLESASTSHQIMLDGSPIVQDVFYRRLPSDNPNGDIYHTVLIMGFRAGAPGYFALDVTDPLNPEFLWQFVGDPASPGGGGGGGPPGSGGRTPMGNSYGTPAMGQVLVDVGGVLQERAIAILPGGAGEEDATRRASAGPVGCPSQGIGQPPVTQGTVNARSRQKCWDRTGRIIQWVDIVTGEIIREFDDTVFNAPLTGGVALYPGGVGNIAERAFFTDADGVMWTADFTTRNPATWDVRPFHDIYHDDGPYEGQPAYNPPLVTSNLDGEVVVLQATGDIDALDGSAQNRVVSLVEHVDNSGATPSYTTEMNWEIRLHAGEQVTGPLELFEGTLYFGSFDSNYAAGDACEFGSGRIWAVDFLAHGGAAPGAEGGSAGYTDVLSGFFPDPRFESSAGSGVFDRHFQPAISNEVVLGVGVTQRPTCVTGSDVADPYIDTRYRVNNTGGGGFVLRAQLSGRNARDADDGAIRTFQQTLPAPQSFTSVSGFAGQVDY